MELNFKVVDIIVSEHLKMYNYSKLTIINMHKILIRFDEFLRNNLNIFDYRNITENHFNHYVEYLKIKVELKTINNYSSYLKKAFDILFKEDKILFNPIFKIKYFKIDKNIKDKVLSEEEISKLINSIDTSNLLGFRNRVILEVLYGTGIRVAELMNLEVKDFIIDEKLLFVRKGKGNKDRIIPVGDNVSKYIYEYIRKIRRKILKKSKSNYLFVGNKKDKICVFHVWNMLRKTAKNVGINKNVSPHILRHTFATHLLKNGVGIREIQILLGHSNISSTQIYISLNKAHLRKEYEKYHPLENELFFDVYGRENEVIKGMLEVGKKYRGNI